MNVNLTRRLVSREGFLTLLTLSVGGLATVVVGIPILGYVLSPLINQPPNYWTGLRFVTPPNRGKTVTPRNLGIGDTREVAFVSNAPLPWAGTTALQGAWLRRTGASSYIAYTLYCTHLGCPIHWLPQPKIFLCPCHGSVFNADGTVAGGPAGRPLFTYQVREHNGQVQIMTHSLPVVT